MVLLKFKGYTSHFGSVKMWVSDSVSLGGAGDDASNWLPGDPDAVGPEIIHLVAKL